MISYDNELYIERAISEGVVNSSFDVSSFRMGHFKGIQAIREYYNTKLNQHIPCVYKLKTNILNTIILKLENREYDGKPVNSIVVENVHTLGEQILLFNEITSLSGRSKILSQDKLYALPSYTKQSQLMDRKDIIPIFNKIKSSNAKLRTRNDFIDYIGTEIIAKFGLDIIIHTLVEMSSL
jgi:hypothetical protein